MSSLAAGQQARQTSSFGFNQVAGPQWVHTRRPTSARGLPRKLAAPPLCSPNPASQPQPTPHRHTRIKGQAGQAAAGAAPRAQGHLQRQLRLGAQGSSRLLGRLAEGRAAGKAVQ